MVDQKTLDRWMDEYINGININRRKYYLLSGDDLVIFVINNYYDMKSDKIVTGENFYIPIGLQYLEYNSFNETAYGGTVKFLLCAAPNNVGKQTILSEMRYYENCNMVARGQKMPVTYIEYAETNKYFRNMGLYKELTKEFAKVVNRDNPLLSTNQSVTGYKCHVYDIMKKELAESGFSQDFRIDGEIDKDYYDYLRGDKPLTLKKSIN